MFSRLLSSTFGKLSIKEPTSSKSPRLLHPTLSFPLPPPAGLGTPSLCSRCLTLLSYVITRFGDGTGYEGLVIPHSSSIPRAGDASSTASNTDLEREILPCVICTRISILFDAARAHISFEPSLRNTPYHDWTLSWRVDAPDPNIYPQFAFPHDSVSVLINVEHKGGYGWGIGGFRLYPDRHVVDAAQKNNLGDYPIIISLDPNEGLTGDVVQGQPELDFSSTLSIGTQTLVSQWAQECATSHPKCHRIFGSNGLDNPVTMWFPDRLIRISPSESMETGQTGAKLDARIVLKSNPADFPPDKATVGVKYLSLSHCWGPSPDPSAPLGGRATTVLNESNLSTWQKRLPVDNLPPTFQHAMMICASLGFEYMWIDSLCILQDSREDWQTQSAVMGDVYKFAWLNVATLSSTSDSQGFINNSRDARVEFGFRAPFASVLGRSDGERNSNGKECILLGRRAKLLWNFSADLPGSTSSNAPLFKRAWVYQERSLARRTLAFAKNTVYWACDECSRGERPDWATGALASTGLRGILHSLHQTMPENRQSLTSDIDMQWFLSVTAYTLCNLTKHTDKLVAISSVARELTNTQIIGKRYLAGLWDVNLAFQIAWITVDGQGTPPRKRVGDEEYTAPSWSWASVEAPVQPRFIFNSADELIALADVRAAEVALETDYAFGSVKAGWLRVWGHLKRLKAIGRKAYRRGGNAANSASLTDEVTGENLWFCPDTVEGCELVESGKGIENLVWMPLTLQFDTRMLNCTCLCLLEVQAEDGISSKDGFVKTGEKVYRRLGTGNFGRLPSMLLQDKLLLGLGTYPKIPTKDVRGEELAKGFQRNEDNFEEFVLI